MKKMFAALVLAVFALASAALAADSAEVLYKSACAGCHGPDGAKAPGGSQPLKGKSSDEIMKMLNGYAAGTYGGKTKNTMESVVAKHKDELKTVADYIGAMK